jgi:hypothetical protein
MVRQKKNPHFATRQNGGITTTDYLAFRAVFLACEVLHMQRHAGFRAFLCVVFFSMEYSSLLWFSLVIFFIGNFKLIVKYFFYDFLIIC